MRPLLPTLTLALLAACSGPFDLDLTTAENIERVVDARVAADGPGVAIGVWRGGNRVANHGTGLPNLEEDVPWTLDTPSYAASITKPMTATMVLSLVDDDVLSLDDRLGDLLDGVPDTYADVTLEQLLSHSSGVPDYLRLNGARRWPDFEALDGTTNEDVVRQVWAADELTYPPGSDHTYSNSGYVLLAEIAVAATDQTYRELISERVWEPAGMTSTTLITADNRDDLARAHRYSRCGAPRDINLLTQGDGGVITTVNDLHAFASALSSGALISKASLDLAWTARPDAHLVDGAQEQHGLGWFVARREGVVRVQQTGRYGGFSNILFLVPELDLTVAILSNGEHRWIYDVPEQILEHVVHEEGD